MRRALVRLFAAISIVAVILVAALVTLTNTDWGRNQVRKRFASFIQDNSHGIVRIGRVSGNLLEGLTLHDLVITDSAGAPFVDVDEMQARYTLRSLSGRRIEFDDVTLVRAVIVLDKKPGGIWNFDRIFPRDTVTPEGRRPTGWGTWIRFTDVTLVDTDITVRTPWEPEARLTGAERDDVIREELGPEGRLVLEEVPGGYQKISKFHRINAKLPLLRLADPGYPTRRADVASLSMIAEPFRPPMADVRSLAGGFDFTGDSLWWENVTATMPGSRMTGSGRYTFDTGDLTLRLRANPVAAADIRWVYPRTPERGSGTLDFAMDWVGDTSIYIARNADVRLEGAHLRGSLGMTIAEENTLHDTDVRFTGLQTSLIERLFPWVDVPRSGVLAGRAKLDGNTRSMAVDGDVTFDERRSGRSRVLAVGEVGFANGEFRAENLRLTMRPVQVDLLTESPSDLPVSGTITGTATLNGSTTSRMTARADITHVDRGSVSRITGTGALRKSPSADFASSWFDVDARVHPLSLVTAGRFFPKAELRGTASGPLRLTGTTRNLAVRADLGFADGGSLDLTGRLDLASVQKGYDVDVIARLFNANAVSAKAPSTSINASASVEGRGTELATMRARVSADIQSSTYDTLSVSAATVRLAADNGMARIDTLTVEVPEGIAQASGTFGLARGRSGELRYRLDVDSLQRLAAFFPPAQPGEIQPRPGILASRMARARADSARIARATEVERAATGREPVTLAQVDTPRAVSRTQLSGSLEAEGIATGNIHDFGVRGTASGEQIVARGHSIGRFDARYEWTNALTPQSRVDVTASATRILASGFDLDSVHTRVVYRKPQGTAELTVVQNAEDVYSVNADYTLDNARNDLRLNRMQLRFDTTLWSAVRPSDIHWGRAGIEIDSLELRNAANGRIFVDGLIPQDGRATLHVAVDNFAVEHLIDLAQSDIPASGLVSFDVRASGTAADPTFAGSFGTERFIYNRTEIPEIHGVVRYEDQTLTGRAEAMRPGQQPLLQAQGTIPINLAFSGVTGSRFPRDRQMDVSVKADSLPLDMVPGVSAMVSSMRGRAMADVRIAGTLDQPDVTGTFGLDSAGAKLELLGITLNRMDGSIRMLRDTVIVDSLVAWSGGRIAITGGLGIRSLTEPSFDLGFVANNATVLDNDHGRLKVNIDATVKGPYADTHVEGAVRILDGVLYIPRSDEKQIIGADDPALFSVMDTAVLANREIFPGQSPLLANLRMDMTLRVDRDVFVRSPDYNIEVYSDEDLAIHVNRARDALVLDGVLLTERGNYSFLSKRFDVKRGSATFTNTGELNPTIQATGGYEVNLPAREALNIEILVGGTLRRPQISLQSDAQPPIPQSDLLSYLTFGRSSSSLLQLEGTGFASGENLVGAGAALASKQLAAVALGVFADELAGEAAQSLGADVFNISPADIQTDVGSFLRSTEIEVGKYFKSHTFAALNLRPDPAALQRPGLLIEHRFGGLRGYSYELSFQPRYLLRDPSLAPEAPTTTSVFSLFFIRNWRY